MFMKSHKSSANYNLCKPLFPGTIIIYMLSGYVCLEMTLCNRIVRVALVCLICILLSITFPLIPSAEAAPVIEFKDGSPKDISFAYDKDGRWVDVYHRFQVEWYKNLEVYFKLTPGDNDWYMKGNVERGEGWFVSFYIEDGNGQPLEQDAEGNPMDHYLGTRIDGNSTPTVLIKQNTVYTLRLRIHVAEGLVYGSRYHGRVIISARYSSSADGQGGISDPSKELLVYMKPLNTYQVFGTVYYKNKETFASNATVTIKNRETGEKVETKCDETGAYGIDLFVLKEGWHNGDRIKLSSSYRGLKASKEVRIDIENGKSRVDLTLKEDKEDYTALMIIITILLIVLGFYLFLRYRSEKKDEAGEEKETKGKTMPIKDRLSAVNVNESRSNKIGKSSDDRKNEPSSAIERLINRQGTGRMSEEKDGIEKKSSFIRRIFSGKER